MNSVHELDLDMNIPFVPDIDSMIEEVTESLDEVHEKYDRTKKVEIGGREISGEELITILQTDMRETLEVLQEIKSLET